MTFPPLRLLTPLVILLAMALVAHADVEPQQIFPLKEGAQFTFQGHRRDGSADTWTTSLRLVDRAKGVFQYQPHYDALSFFSKAGLWVTAAGIHIVGQSLDGDPPPAPALAIAFPLRAKARGEVPGLFPCVYQVLGRERVTVHAGTFDAWRVSLKDKVNPEGMVWIAPGVGVVKLRLPSGRVDELQ